MALQRWACSLHGSVLPPCPEGQGVGEGQQSEARGKENEEEKRGPCLLSLGGLASVGLTGISCVTSKGHMGRPGSVPTCGKGMAAVFSGCTMEKG